MIICGVLLYFINNNTINEQNQIIITKQNAVKLISSVLETKFSEKIKTMQRSGYLDSVRNVPYADQIDESIKGIPDNLDVEKRIAAQRILRSDNDFNVVFFVVPNGDMYIQEPYSAQINNNVLNFAFRDWYKGAVSSNHTYVSEAYMSQATDRKAVAISEPIYSNNDILAGLWVGLINLDSLEQQISNLDFSDNRRILIADHHGNTIIDTGNPDNDKSIQHTDLESIRSALDGKSGSITETINGTKMFSVYQYAKIGPHNWAVVLTQPYENAFTTISTSNEFAYLIIVIIIVILAASGFFTYRLDRSNQVLANKLHNVDIQKDEFSAMITHELKTPLVPIIGYCKMLKTEMLGKMNAEQQSAIKTIDENAKNLEKLISDILDVRKLELDRIKFHTESISMDEFFDGIGLSYQQVLDQNGKEFVVDVLEKKLYIQADRARLRQVFDNLISNAIKFTPSMGAKIVVGCYKTNGSAILYVKDNGMGIPPEEQSNLFKKFYQIDTSERRKIGGTGLGLAICKGMIEKMGGSIYLESDGKTGSTFYMEFNVQ